MNAKLFSKENCVADCFVKLSGNFLVGVHGVAVTAQCTDFNIILFNKSLELFKLILIAEKLLGVGMAVAGVAAATNFNHFNALGFKIFECLFERKIS